MLMPVDGRKVMLSGLCHQSRVESVEMLHNVQKSAVICLKH